MSRTGVESGHKTFSEDRTCKAWPGQEVIRLDFKPGVGTHGTVHVSDSRLQPQHPCLTAQPLMLPGLCTGWLDSRIGRCIVLAFHSALRAVFACAHETLSCGNLVGECPIEPQGMINPHCTTLAGNSAATCDQGRTLNCDLFFS